MSGYSKIKAKKEFCRLIVEQISLALCGICFLIYFVTLQRFCETSEKMWDVDIFICVKCCKVLHPFLSSISCAFFNALRPVYTQLNDTITLSQ